MTDQIRELVLQSKRIPSISTQTQRLLTLMRHDDLSIDRLAAVIEESPAMTARLLALANSAWYAPAQPITSASVACARLGLTLVKAVCIGLSVIAPFSVTACRPFDIKRFWLSSTLAAEAAYRLAAPLGDKEFSDAVHTGGLLHCLGLLCIVDLLPLRMDAILLRARQTPRLNLSSLLQQEIGMDYAEIGGMVAKKWELPEVLVAVIRYHRQAGYRAAYRQHVHCVGIAADMASALYARQEEFVVDSDDNPAIGADVVASVYRQMLLEQPKFNSQAEILF